MKKLVISAIFSLIVYSSAFSQSRWINLNSLPSLTGYDRYEDVYFINPSTGWVIHFSGKIYKTVNGGITFTQQSNNSGAVFRCTGFFDENTGIIGTLNDTASLLRTTNSGLNWSRISNINGAYPLGICGIHIVNSNTAIGVGRYSCPPYFLKTTDKGVSWVSYSMEPAQIKSLVDCYFWSADSGIVVGGYNPANNYQVSNSVILLTVDGGKSFTTVFKSSRTSEWCWKINFVNANTGFVSIEAWNYGVVLKTTNKGLNWSEQVFNTADDLEGIGFINENTGWIGSHDLTHETTNGSANWSLVTWGNKINRFRFISDTLGYSVGNSIYKFTQESVSVSSISEKIPEYFYLQQNFPNPFNPSTRINYELRLSGFVTLKVYDIKGSEVQELVNEKQNEGIYSAEFDGSALPSGIYYYKLTAGEFSETRKMVLAK